METVALRFVRWGTAFLLLGAITGYGPLHHYLHGGVEQSCPWAPVHGHVALLGWIGCTLFGLVYGALPRWGAVSPRAVRLARAHLRLAVIGVLGVFTNGTFGYRLLDLVSPSFYYLPQQRTLNLWLAIDGAFLTLYSLGGLLLLAVLSELRRAAAPAG